MPETIDPTLRGQTSQDAILEAITARLIDRIDGYADQNCFISDDPEPSAFPGKDEFCSVSIGDGNFPAEFFTGGGDDTLCEDGSIIIAPTLPTRGGRSYRRHRFISGEHNGKTLLNRKRQILAALFRDDWEPVVGEKPLLRDMISPLHCTRPFDVKIGEAWMLQMRLTIRTTFDWDLSDA